MDMTDNAGRVAVFDLDGTLVDTSGDMIAAANVVMAGAGLGAIDPVADRRLGMRGGKALLRAGAARVGALWSEAELDVAYRSFLEVYAARPAARAAWFPGVEAGLDALMRAGIELAICTNKPEAPARAILDALDPMGRFASVVGAVTLAVRKPDPLPLVRASAGAGRGPAVFVGDSLTEARTAAHAGVPFCFVTYGTASPDEVSDYPCAIAEDFEAVVGWVLSRLGRAVAPNATPPEPPHP